LSEVHPFSPIVSEARLQEAIAYVTAQSLALARMVLGHELPVDTVCLFTHSAEEYAFVEAAVHARGPESKLSHGPTTYVDTDFMVGEQRIRIFGVRQPDSTRPQVGYGDYPVPHYAALREKERDNQFVQEIISGRGKPLLMLRHPEFDVLGFAVDAEEHQRKT
jgi:hypothetical protein